MLGNLLRMCTDRRLHTVTHGIKFLCRDVVLRLSLQYPPVKPMIAFQDCDFQFLLAARNLSTSPTRRPQLCKTIGKEIRKKNREPKASMLQCILENFGFREFMIIYIVINFFLFDKLPKI